MARARVDPYLNFNFRVEIDGISDVSFKEVVMPSSSFDVIEFRSGEGGPCEVRKLLGRLHQGNLVLRRGITESNALFAWWQSGCENADRRNVSVILLDRDRTEVKRWGFFNALPVRYEVSPLDADASAPAIETLEITFEAMTVEA